MCKQIAEEQINFFNKLWHYCLTVLINKGGQIPEDFVAHRQETFLHTPAEICKKVNSFICVGGEGLCFVHQACLVVFFNTL